MNNLKRINQPTLKCFCCGDEPVTHRGTIYLKEGAVNVCVGEKCLQQPDSLILAAVLERERR